MEFLDRTPDEGAARLRALGGVLEARPDYRVRIAFTPNDPLFATDPITGLGQWGLRKAQVDKAWDTQRGSPSITVAIIDSGVDASHPDLQGALVTGARFVGAADPLCPAGATNRDDNGHGTHVAGVIGANGNNGQGVAGVAFGVKVMPIKALDCNGAGFLQDVATAIRHAVDNGARVVNVSLGSPFDSASLRDAVEYALSKNVVVVAAAGNCGSASGTVTCPSLNAASYPAAHPGVVAVTATDTNDEATSFSTAASYVDVAAPGVSIVSTFPTYHVALNDEGIRESTYASFRGTSQAAPFVAGVIGLLLSRDPTLTPAQVEKRLRATADDVDAGGFDAKTGDGRVNAQRALAGGTPASLEVAPPRATLVPNASQQFVARVKDGFGSVIPGSPVTWSATGGAITSAGLYTAGSALGAFAVTARAGALSATAPVTIEPPRYAATYSVQTVRTALASGAAGTFKVALTNTSNFPWNAAGSAPVRVSSHWLDAKGDVVVWDGPRGALPSDVATGATVVADVPLQVPAQKGQYTLQIDLVREGLAWFSQQGAKPASLGILVNSGFGATYEPSAASLSLATGTEPRPLSVRLTNTGSRVWPAKGGDAVRFSYHWRGPSGTVVVWDGERGTLPGDVAPGTEVPVSLPVAPPPTPGSYVLELDLVQEGVVWFSADGVPPRALTVTATSGYGARYTVPAPPPLLAGVRARLGATLENGGAFTWSPTGAQRVRLAYHVVDAQGNLVVWDGARAELGADTPPGATARTELLLDAPRAPGTYTVRVDLVREGVAWFSGQGVATLDLPLTVGADRRATVLFATPSVSRSAPQPIAVAVRNTSPFAFASEGAGPVFVASHWLTADGRVLLWDGPRAPLPKLVLPGEEVTVALPLAPPPEGAAVLAVELVQEGFAWFGGASQRAATLQP